MKEHNLDKFPTKNKLKEFGYYGLSLAIHRYHGGFPNFREKHFGEEPFKKPNRYWNSLDNCLDEAKKIMKEQEVDRLPSSNKLKERGYSSLSMAISKHHGGFSNFREKHFNEKPLKKSDGYWKSLENTIYESKKVMEEQGVDILPSANKLKEIGHSSLSDAITLYHGGLPNFREIMHQELGIKSNKEHLTEVWKKYISE
jgi:hypothetical protein